MKGDFDPKKPDDPTKKLLETAQLFSEDKADPVAPPAPKPFDPSVTNLLGVDVTAIPTGVNNEPVKEIKFKFDMVDFNVARLAIGEANGFSIPDSVVPKPAEDVSKRMEMLGFELTTKDGFSFKFKDNGNGGADWIDTFNRTLVVGTKYSQMDFTLPSWNVTGFGERVF